MAATGYNALGLDWQTPISEARRRVGGKVALQGNLDPVALYASPESIRGEVKKILTDFGFQLVVHQTAKNLLVDAIRCATRHGAQKAGVDVGCKARSFGPI